MLTVRGTTIDLVFIEILHSRRHRLANGAEADVADS
jgi:hypothetical protein